MTSNNSVERASALADHYDVGRHGADGEPGVVLQDIQGLILHQVGAWPESIDEVAGLIVSAAGAKSAPGPCLAETGSAGTLIRIEPLKWWMYGVDTPELTPDQGATLDLSHSRTQIRITGPEATTFLNRHISLDLREKSFPIDAVGSTVMHHVGVTLWRSAEGYELFIPRGFALALWEGMVESADQFGLEIV